MKMCVRLRGRVGKCQDMEKKEKDSVHPVSGACWLLNFDPSREQARYLPLRSLKNTIGAMKIK